MGQGVSFTDIYDAIRGRRSIRRFRPDPVADEVLERVVDAACRAPFGTRRDERVLEVLGGEEKTRLVEFIEHRLEAVIRAMGEGPSRQTLGFARAMLPAIEQAPVVVAVFTAIGREGPELSISSAACAVQNLMLAATAEGLGACYLTGALALGDEIAHLFGLADYRLIALVPLGFPSQTAPERRDFPAVVWRGFQGRERGEVPQHPRPRADDAAPPGPAAAASVLIVTDTPDVDAPMVNCLRRAGFSVTVTGATEAVEAFRQGSPDVTIIDSILGDRSGYALTAEMNEATDEPAPILVTTSAYDDADEQEALRAGAFDVLTKPIRDHELLARVRALAEGRALFRQVKEHAEELARVNAELLELQKLRDDLTHMIVHDMRTPLTNIITGLQTVEMAEFEEELSREFIPEAINAGMDLQDMINNLLDISKMEAGELVPERGEVDLRALTQEVFERVGHLVREGGLTLSEEVAEGLTLRADRALLKRVLLNLLGNAIKFTPEGGSVTVEAAEADEGIRVCVTDTGPGIPPEQQARLFRKFAQLEGTKKKQGTGLGLAFVRMATEAHGGRAWVESEVGKGSSFCFVIPEAPGS